MRAFILAENIRNPSGSSFCEGKHYAVPQGMAWRIDIFSCKNLLNTGGTAYLIVKNGGNLQYIAPAVTLSTSLQSVYTYACVLYEGDEIYVFVTGLSGAAEIEYSMRGLEVEQAKIFYRF